MQEKDKDTFPVHANIGIIVNGVCFPLVADLCFIPLLTTGLVAWRPVVKRAIRLGSLGWNGTAGQALASG